jgi:hypothetical protein
MTLDRAVILPIDMQRAFAAEVAARLPDEAETEAHPS